VGNDSPAELFREPCGMDKAESIFPSTWKEFWALCDVLFGESRALEKWNEFFALEKKEAALVTELLRRFFSEVRSS
jgi:hypothetical protein